MNLSSKKLLMGIDEAGRGPLAGPVTLAAVACPKAVARILFKGIKDSKRLSLKSREAWLEKMKNHPGILYCSASVGASTIDRIGIAPSIRRAIGRILAHEKIKKLGRVKILLDGSLKATEKYLQKTVIKGDEKIPIIAAASIVAKVSRDRKMARFSRVFPEYAFDVHKGYGTRLHYKMLKKHGLCGIHRKSFLAKILN